MVRLTVVVCVIPPPVPVTVMVLEPAAALRLTVTVIVEVPAPFIDVGLKPTVTRDPVTVPDRLMDELKPPLTVVVMVTLPDLPGDTVRDVGEAEIVKLVLVFVTVRLTVVVSTVPLPVPVTVMV